MNGDQFFGAYSPQFESFEADHPKAFRAMLKRMRDTGARLIFLSGDRHFLEFQNIEPDILGYPTVELTSSAIHAKVFPALWPENPNPRQAAGVANTHNFLVLEVKRSGSEWIVRAEGRGPGGKVLAKKEVRIPSAAKA